MRIAFVLLLVCTVFAGSARAEDVSASASLSNATVSLGEPVELQITVHGSQKAAEPRINVDGLSVQYNGASTQIQMNNFDVTRSIVHTYTVLPQREGTFTIPSLTIDAGGKKVSTQPLTLTVSRRQAGGAQVGAAAGNNGGGNVTIPGNEIAFAEWVIPKTTAYVGEAIPVELRLYVLSQIRWDIRQMPSVSAEGFTIQKLPKPTEGNINKNGREYHVVVFKTAIIPAKAGKLTLPATDLNTVMALPQKRAQRQRPQGFPNFPGFPDPFNDPFFDNIFNNQQVTVRPDPVELEVKPLPAAGRPANFSGAVGQFTMEADAAPKQVRVGDPVTISAVVKGIGCFDRVNAPTVAEENDWRLYPPSVKFQPDDEVGISGAKTFEMAAIPEAVKTELPKIEFSFFNPSTEKYETLTGKRIPLIVQGAPASSSTPGTLSAAPVAPSAPAAAPTPAPAQSDIEYIRVDAGTWSVSFEPVWKTCDFWYAQFLPLGVLLALGGWQWRRARLSNATARRAARLRQLKAEVFRTLRQEKTSAADFYDAAIRAIQIETALGQIRSEIDPETIDAEAAIASRTLDCETLEGVRHIFAAHDQLRYAGVATGGGSGDSIYPDQREQVLKILAQFEKSHA